MGNEVYANGREVSCKAADGKSICCFPDVCFTPPMCPATPPGVPIPYPNTGMAKDTTNGTKSVKITNKEVIKKNQSYFKKSYGDEAGCATKKGVITSTNRGKVYFTSWSMDVKVEGKNVTRMMDLTTHNHMSMPGNTPTWPYLDGVAMDAGGKDEKCKDEKKAVKDNCSGNFDDDCASKECSTAKKCMLVPHTPTGAQTGCCPGVTPDHMIEVHCFTESGGRSSGRRLPGFSDYNDRRAPCVCAKGSRYSDEHGEQHAIRGMFERSNMDADGPRSQMGGKDGVWTYGKAKKGALIAHKKTFEKSACSDDCIEAQLDGYHKTIGVDDNTPIRADKSPLKDDQKVFGQNVIAQNNSAAQSATNGSGI